MDPVAHVRSQERMPVAMFIGGTDVITTCDHDISSASGTGTVGVKDELDIQFTLVAIPADSIR